MHETALAGFAENWEDARNSAVEAKAVDPTSTKAMFRFGVACTNLGMYDEAKADLRRAIELEPKDKCVGLPASACKGLGP